MRLMRLVAAVVLVAAGLAVAATPSAAAVTIIERPNGIVDVNGDNGVDDVVICSVDGQLTVFSDLEPIGTIPPTVRILRINLRGGDDFLLVGPIDPCDDDQIEIPLDLRIILGSGNDILGLSTLSVGRNLILLGQGGEEQINLFGVEAGRLNANTSSGPSMVDITGSQFGRVSIRGGSSRDQVVVMDSTLGRNPVIFTNSGEDEIVATNATATGRVTINTGSGNDNVDWTDETGCEDDVCADNTRGSDYKLNVIMGAGNDTTRTAIDLMPGDRLNGGAGNQDLLLFFAPGGATINAYEFFGSAVNNTAPTANDDNASTESGVPVEIPVLDNDVDPDGDLLDVVAIDGSPLVPGDTVATPNGSVTLNADGTLTYVSDPEFDGTETFQYSIEDGNGSGDSATVEVLVELPNQPPIANDDIAVTEFETPVEIDVLANDDDPDSPDAPTVVEINGIPVTPGGATQVLTTGGIAELLLSGDILYSPAAGFSGRDSFIYTIADGDGETASATVQVTVGEPPNVPPVANDDTAVAEFNGQVDIDVVDNDNDPDSPDAPVVVEINGTPVTPGDNNAIGTGSGSAELLSTGTIRFISGVGFRGDESFTYTIEDDDGATDSATVTVTVLPPPNILPIANDDRVVVPLDTPTVIDPLANDSDPDSSDPLTIVQIRTTAVTPGDGVEVALVTGTATLLADGTIRYTPNVGATGGDGFLYVIEDVDGGQATGEVFIRLNSPPTADDDTANTDFDTAVDIDVLANDSDPDTVSEPIVTAIEGTPVTAGGGDLIDTGSGLATLLANGQIQYTPNSGFSGDDSFVYEIADIDGATDSAVVTVTVADPPNNPPDAVDDLIFLPIFDGGSDILTPLDNDSDLDGDPLTIVAIDGVPIAPNGNTSISSGDLTLSSDGTRLAYIFHGGDFFSDSFTYTISDGRGGTDTATVTISFEGE